MTVVVAEANFLQQVPNLPGVYRFYGQNSLSTKNKVDSRELLYIGKAIDLHKRVKSYFQKNALLSPRISLMVKKIATIEFTITENEASALILENNLIKELKPKYNIVFRDDKSYPLICLSGDKFPRITSYRGKKTSNADYFGPYPNVNASRHAIDQIQRIFKLRTCENSAFSNRSRPCMLYQIKLCTAPCVNKVTATEYMQQVKNAKDFLNGNFKSLMASLSRNMQDAASTLDFETAASLRDEIGILKAISEEQVINRYKKPINADLIVSKNYAGDLFFYLILLRNGIYVGDKHFVFKQIEDEENVAAAFFEGYYLDNKLTSNKLQVYANIGLSSENMAFYAKAFNIEINTILPKPLLKLHNMAMVNLEQIVKRQKDDYQGAILRLCELLGMSMIDRVECIDISHNHGENTVASIVVYADGIINPSLYRRYNLRVGNDGLPLNGNDLKAFEVVLVKRFADTLELPNILVVDGGLLQLNITKKILKAIGILDKIVLVAIFKGEGRDLAKDRIILPNGAIIGVEKEMVLLKFIQNLRDEAHRFAITGHRKKQIKKMTYSQLDEIPQIGAQKKRELLAFFGDVAAIANASIVDLKKVSGIGEAIAQEIYHFFHGSK